MWQNRRQAIDALRLNPALFTGFPGEAVDIDRLVGHLSARSFDGALHATDGVLEGVLWFRRGIAEETWYAEAGGSEAVLPGGSGPDLLRTIAERGGTVSVLCGASSIMSPDLPGGAPPAVGQSAREDAAPERPWPQILGDAAARIERQRGARLAGLFLSGLERALSEHGGRIENGAIVAPALPDSVWRVAVEAACAPVAAVAGRAFADRTIAAAERAILNTHRPGSTTTAGGDASQRP